MEVLFFVVFEDHSNEERAMLRVFCEIVKADCG